LSAELVISFVITALMLAGVAARRRRAVHVPVMWSVIAADLVLLLWVETRSSAIETVAEGAIPAFLWVHVGLSAVVGVGYVLASVSGLALHRDPGSRLRRLHRGNGWTVAAARFGVLVTTPGLLYDLPS